MPLSAFDYALVTDYDNMYATKPQLTYYEEILATIGCLPGRALMVGDSWENDMLPASQLGLFTYWVSEVGEEPPQLNVVTEYGSLERLYELLHAGWLQ